MSNPAQEEADRLFNYKPSITSHPEDSSRDNHSDLDSEDEKPRRGIQSKHRSDHEDQDTDDEDTTRYQSALSGTKQSYTVPTTAQYANTGPKGVIADAQNYHRAKRTGTNRVRRDTSTITQQTPTVQAARRDPASDQEDEEEEDDALNLLNDPENDPFMSTWRAKRLAELQEQFTSPLSQSHPRQTYGTLTPVSDTGYIEAIETTPAPTNVVVLIHDPLNAASLEVEDEMKMLAYKWTKTRFVKLHQKVAGVRALEVPAVLVYRGGEVVVVLSGVDGEAGVGEVLRGRGVLER